MKYDVIMRTQLGDRHGVLELDDSRPDVKGVLHILGKDSFLRGSIAEDGKCRLEGMLRTLMRTTPFTADGVISAHYLDLVLHGQHGAWALKGMPMRSESKSG